MTEVITLGDTLCPPVVNPSKASEIYDLVRTDEFEADVFNALLMAVVVYLDAHGVEYADKQLPWAESVGTTQ